MKTIYLFRHAKSSWSEENINDSDRPLKAKGIRDACHKAGILSSQKTPIDLLITSPAFRALNTSIIVAKQIKYPLDRVVINADMYDKGFKKILEVIENFNNNVSSVILFGHNPDLTELSNYLAEGGIKNIPTSGLVCIEFDSTDWRKLGKGTVKFTDFSKSGNNGCYIGA